MTRAIKIKGRVLSGVGKGAYYVKLKPYYSLFKSLLEKAPYPGTLNVRVEDGRLNMKDLPHRFKPNEFGEVRYALGEICGIKILILRPCKSIHPENIFEIVAPVKLRDMLRLQDGETIEFTIYLPDQSKRKSE